MSEPDPENEEGEPPDERPVLNPDAGTTAEEAANEPDPETAIGADEPEEQDVFRNVYGHNGAKTLVSAALRQGDTHVLLEGPPGSGKSVFLLALESNVPGTIYRDGDQITPSKMREALKDNPPILLVDEIDALDNEGYDVLSLPMEHGRLVRDSARESYDIDVDTQVIAACNHADELPEHIRNRFRVLEFEKYTDAEFLDLCEKMLASEIDWIETEEEARAVAEKVYETQGEADVRTTRDIAQMAGSVEEIETLSKAMADPNADVEATPLMPSEIKRTQGEVGKVRLRQTLAEEMVRSSQSVPEESEEPKAEPTSEDPTADDEAPSNVEEEIEGAVEEAVADG